MPRTIQSIAVYPATSTSSLSTSTAQVHELPVELAPAHQLEFRVNCKRPDTATEIVSEATQMDVGSPPLAHLHPSILIQTDMKKSQVGVTRDLSDLSTLLHQSDEGDTANTNVADEGLMDLFTAARRNAPRCGDIPLQWMTIAQAAATLCIHKAVLSNWSNRGYIATIKSPGSNNHRLVHLDNILVFMHECIMRSNGEEQDAGKEAKDKL
jgi:hypothetical protein